MLSKLLGGKLQLLTGINKKEYDGRLRFSSDGMVCMLPLTGASDKDGESLAEIKMGQKVTLEGPSMRVASRARVLVSVNPELKEYFRSIEAPHWLDRYEDIEITATAKKNINLEELMADRNSPQGEAPKDPLWLYRVMVIES